METTYARPEPVQRAPFWNGSTVQRPALQNWPYRVGDFPRGTTSTSSFVQVAGGVGRLGRLGQATTPPEAASELVGYALASTLGSALGGALLGYVAAGNREGAVRGAWFSAGLTAAADAYYFAREKEIAPAVGFGIAGAVGIGYAIARLRKRRR